MNENDIDQYLGQIACQMDLDAETEQEVLEEIRDHLATAVEQARVEGLDETQALARAAAHAGWGTADAVVAAALPVVCALVLRWLAFAPDGTALGWPQLLARPAFWVVALAALLLPFLRLERWRYALAVWAVFWTLTVVFVALPAERW